MSVVLMYRNIKYMTMWVYVMYVYVYMCIYICEYMFFEGGVFLRQGPI